MSGSVPSPEASAAPQAQKPRRPTYESNPGRYAELSKPFESQEAATAALDAFSEEVKALRVKYKLRDVHVLFRLSAMANGEQQELSSSMHMGSTSLVLPMLATAFGNERAAWKIALERMSNPKIVMEPEMKQDGDSGED